MIYLKPYGTLDINHIAIEEPQRLKLYWLRIIKKWINKIHVNQLAMRHKAWYIDYITEQQASDAAKIFESVGYRFKDWEVRKTQVGTSLIFDHNK